MLQVIQAAIIGDSRDHSSKLQRRKRNALAERAHLAYSTQFLVEFNCWECAKVFTVNVVSSELTETKLLRVVADFFKSQAATNLFKVRIVGMRQCLCEIHSRAAAQPYVCVF